MFDTISMHTVYLLYIWTKQTENWDAGMRCETLHFAPKIGENGYLTSDDGDCTYFTSKQYMLNLAAFSQGWDLSALLCSDFKKEREFVNHETFLYSIFVTRKLAVLLSRF